MPPRKRRLRRGGERQATRGGIAPPTTGPTNGRTRLAATPGSGQRHRPTGGADWPGPGGLGGILK